MKLPYEKLQISEIQIIPIKPKDGLVAFASCVINNCLYIGNITLYTSFSRPKGYRLVYPSKILANGKKVNCIHPINKKVGELITARIIKKYTEIILGAKRRKNLNNFP
jgi:DNA-binding cell septation regulator SpoVG